MIPGLLLAAAGAALAAPGGTPHLVQESPRAAIQANTGDPLALVWDYYSAPSPIGPSANTTYFRLCLDESPQQPCSIPGTQWLIPSTSIPSVAILSSPPAAAPIGRRHRFELPSITAAQLDRRLEWTVSPCLSEWDVSCSPGLTQYFYLSTKNVKARRINDLSGATLLWIAGVAENTGTSSTGPFHADIFIAEAFMSPRRTCSTDIDEVVSEYGVIPDCALAKTGAEIDLRRLPNKMVGKLEIPEDTGLEEIVELMMTNSKPTAYAQRLRVDSFGALVEFNDEDNYVGECDVIHCEVPPGEQECR